MLAFLVPFALTACSGDLAPDAEDGVLDLRQEFPDPPEGGLQFVSGELEVPPYSERQFCLYGTYDGPTVGLHASEGFQAEYGHHVVLLATNFTQDEHPDGEMADCTEEADSDMLRMEPLFIQGSYDPDFAGASSLPPGMAMAFEQGTRYIVQSHYINTTEKTLRVQDAMNLALLAEEDVETWAATIAHSTISFSLPPGEVTSVEIDCAFEEELNLLNVSGHMHERGTAFKVDYRTAEGEESVLYDVPEWSVEYRDDPVLLDFGDAPLALQPGDAFRTTCTWDNPTDEAILFPEEMCATVGVVYPRREALTCVAGF